MPQIGDDTAGFAIDFDGATSIMRVRAWGFWDAETGRAFGRTVTAECRRSSPAIASMELDMKELKPMRDEGQSSFGDLISTLAQLHIPEVKVQTSSQLTKLQLMRIVNERDKDRRVQFL